MDSYKNGEDSDASISKYKRFYNNTEMKRKIDENTNFEDDEEKEENSEDSQFYDINYLIENFLNQDAEISPCINSILGTINKKSNNEEFESIITQTNFIAFLIDAVVEIPQELIIRKIKFLKLIHAILKEFKQFHIVFFDGGLVPILSDFIKYENNPRILTYAVFSLILLFKSFGYTNSSYFEDYISITILRDTYDRIKQLSNQIGYIFYFLKGAIVLSSFISSYPLNNEDSISAFELSSAVLIQPRDENAKNILKEWNEVYVFALKTLSYLFENDNINLEDFDDFHMYDIIKARFRSSSMSNQIFSCDIFVALFKKYYFQNHYFDIHIFEILDYIDQNKCKSAFLRLISAIVKYSDIDDEDSYINQFFFTSKNENGVRTICQFLNKSESSDDESSYESYFDVILASAHCLIEIFLKINNEMLDTCLELDIIKSVVNLIDVGLDYDDEELLFDSLRIIYRILEYSQAIDRHEQIVELFLQAGASQKLEDIEQHDFENADITHIYSDIYQLFNDCFEE